jgi:fibronectin-binding autotransporter adhesin
VAAAPGNYGTSTTYTILNATGGVSGAYSGVSSNFAFLTPSLSYNANNVFLTLALQGNAFSGFGGSTVNQRAVGYALDQSFANATGDFATVIGALAGLSTSQAPAALDAISGQPYADFGTTNVANASLFMSTLGQQMALARSGSAPGARVALAQACEVKACDEARPLSAWFSGLGGLGSVQGDGNSSTFTYNVGGAAAGIDYRFDPRFLVGVGVGYTHGTQWMNSFMGQGWTDSVSVAAYGSFTQAGFYADALVGYAYLNNQIQRQIQIPGLQQRTASGSTGANQFLAQVETGYELGVWTMGSVTPFARFQTSSTAQNAFTESGASSLNLNVAQQTTNSVRTVLGAEFGSSIPLGTERALGLSLRLGWQHEYAYTGRPITSSFAGAPSASFTVYSATPTRDSAIVGFAATTSIAAATQLYLRYDGELASGTDNHALTAGLRMSW